MALSPAFVGRQYRCPDYCYAVEREKTREHADAVKNGDPLTSTSMLGYAAQTAFFADANTGITDKRVVQVDQVLKFLKPIQAGDTLYRDIYVHDIRQAHGTDIIVTKNVVSNQNDEVVQETYTTLAGRSEEDGESGFNDGTA